MSAINRKMIYAASKTILYDADEQLFYCKAGELTDNGFGKLLFTAWGETKEECQKRTDELVAWLNWDIIV